jgi:hypothetical protein
MTTQLSQVLRDCTGATGRRIIRAILAGERAPHPLAALRHSRCQKDAEAMALALTGTWREEPLFVLTPARALCAFYPAQVSVCDAHLAQAFAVIKPAFASAPEESGTALLPPPPRRQPHAHRQKAPAGHPRAPLLRIPGVALVAGHGISPSIAQTIVSEMGMDMSQWPDEQPYNGHSVCRPRPWR